MDFKGCKVLNDRFRLDQQFNVVLATNGSPVTDGLAKGYVYSAMFLYDEVDKEIKKLEKVVRKQMDAVLMESPNIQVPILLLEISRRVAKQIGDDSLDALIKEVLSERQKHISLATEQKEVEKLNIIKESIFTETAANLFQTVIENSSVNIAGYNDIVLAEAYVGKMTPRQKRLLSPALKMVGFMNDRRIDELSITPDFHVVFKAYSLPQPFHEKEEGIKTYLKNLMGGNI